MCADILIAEVGTYDAELLLNSSFCDREYNVVAADAVSQTVVLQELPYDNRDCEYALFLCLLLRDGEPISVAVLDDVRETQPQNIADTDSEVRFQNQRRCDSFIRIEAGEPVSHGFDNLGVLLPR